MRKLALSVFTVLILASLLLAACGPAATPTPEKIIQTVEVEKTVIQTQIVQVTPTGQAAPTTYPRNETIYISGAAWGPPSTWNPFQPGMLANATGTIGFVYEFLFNYDPLTDKFIPWLAEKGNWTDPTTYEVTLRKGLTWSDGKPLTAEDVKFTLELGKKYPALWFSPLWTNT
ncbi:MAG: ABC transporter substrate-binding protein, partial [Thermanaerothrix sp.]|nr:ABC transporter substrate-binding protein [Thermanaerothrix sp.]